MKLLSGFHYRSTFQHRPRPDVSCACCHPGNLILNCEPVPA